MSAPGSSVTPLECFNTVSWAVPATALLRATSAEPRMVLGKCERAVLPDTLNSITPSEGPSSTESVAGTTLAVKVACSPDAACQRHKESAWTW